MKKLMIFIMILLLVGAWIETVTSNISKPIEYQELLQEADHYETKEIYYDAIQKLQKALEYDPSNGELYKRMAEDYLKLGEEEEFIESCNTAISLNKDNEETIFLLTDYYLNTGRREDAIALLKKQIEKKKRNAAVKARLESLAGEFSYIGQSYTGISQTGNNCMLVRQEDLYGMLDGKGSVVIRPKYDSLNLFGSEDLAPVCLDGEWYMIDKNEYRRRVPEKVYTYLGIENYGRIPACLDGKWGYLNSELEPLQEFVYEAATPFLDGYAAVKKDGKWGLIDTNLNMKTNYLYDDIVTDDWGFATRNGVIFVRENGTYHLIDSNGKALGEHSFLEAKPYLSENPAAVFDDKGWHFLSVTGEIMQDCNYEEASSFSVLGYAAVCREGLWGYIRDNGDILIPLQFEGAGPFNSNGIAAVKEGGLWELIMLDIY